MPEPGNNNKSSVGYPWSPLDEIDGTENDDEIVVVPLGELPAEPRPPWAPPRPEPIGPRDYPICRRCGWRVRSSYFRIWRNGRLVHCLPRLHRARLASRAGRR
jgi:hypothetical protein